MNSKTSRIPIVLATLLLGAHQILTAANEVGLLVKWKDGPESYAAAVGNAWIGSRVKRNFTALGWQLVQLPQGLSVSEGIKAYQELGTVTAVEPDGRTAIELPPPLSTNSVPRAISRHSQTPNDPRYSSQWYLPKISAPTAWDVTTGSSNVVVAIIDTGVDYTHPDLAANMWRNPGETGLDDQGRDKATNGIDDDNNGYVDDVHGVNVIDQTGDPMDIGFWDPPNSLATSPIYHGTFIAGIVGAVGDNGTGIAGLNWTVQIMAIRTYGGDRSDPRFIQVAWSDVLAAFDYVITMKRRGVNVRVTNNSYGGFLESVAVRDAVDAAGHEGILSVCAAGNNVVNGDVFSFLPASFNVASVISVAASTEADTLADFSNYGPSTVDLAAPGVNITSTWKGSEYRSGQNGTSYAGPMVVGAAALLLAADPSLTVHQLKAALFGSVDQPASLRGKVVTNGRLNIARALQYLTNADPPAIVITASPEGQRTPTNAPIQCVFNRPMNHASVESAFIITPPVGGTFEWSGDSRSFSYRHAAPFDATTNYIVRILGTAQDENGGTLDGDFDRTREGSPADDYVWTFRFPIPNDDFANARRLTGLSGSITGNNRYASDELDEPRTSLGDWRIYGSSLWYQWTAPAPGGWTTFDLTSATAFDSMLIIYTGDRLNQLVPIIGNDNYGTKLGSRVSFAPVPGTNYSIVVASKDEFDPTRAGTFRLTWYPTPSPGLTGWQFSPASGIPGAKVTLTGTNFTGATSVLFNGADATFANAPTNNLDLRITAVVPPDATSGPITILTPHGNVTSTASFQVLPPPLSISLSATDGVVIRWPATGNAFVLEATDDLAAGSWSVVEALTMDVGDETRIGVPAPKGVRFFRLRSR
jgi:subtilisin family serine protease